MKKFRELMVETTIDKKGVTIDPEGIEGNIPQEDLKNVYVRDQNHKNTIMDSDMLKMPFANQSQVVGWFATKPNMASGYVIQLLSPAEKKEFGDAYRIYSTKGTTVAKIDIKKGKVSFLDNTYYENNDEVKYLRPMMWHRMFIDNTPKAFKTFDII